MRCTRGAIFDVIVDLRPDSPTFKQHLGVVLTAENRRMLYVPEGFAHGFLTLEDDTEVFYQISEFYEPGVPGASAGTIRPSASTGRRSRSSSPSATGAIPTSIPAARAGDERRPSGATSRRPAAGQDIVRLMAELYPICRSITGDGAPRDARRS